MLVTRRFIFPALEKSRYSGFFINLLRNYPNRGGTCRCPRQGQTIRRTLMRSSLVSMTLSCRHPPRATACFSEDFNRAGFYSGSEVSSPVTSVSFGFFPEQVKYTGTNEEYDNDNEDRKSPR